MLYRARLQFSGHVVAIGREVRNIEAPSARQAFDTVRQMMETQPTYAPPSDCRHLTLDISEEKEQT
jgi:hypothetical protein